MTWTLWHTDLFDRETPPSREAEGPSLADGLAALWRFTLEQSISSEGGRSFSSFGLAWQEDDVPGRGASIDTFRTGELVRLRAFVRQVPALLEAVAAAHLRLLRRHRAPDLAVSELEESSSILDEVAAADSAAGLLDSLRAL